MTALRGEIALPPPPAGDAGPDEARADPPLPGTSAQRAEARRQLAAYVRTFVRSVPRARLGAGAALALAAALTEGIGLALLLPLLALVDGSASTSAGMAAHIFAAIGLPFSLPSLVLAFVGLIALKAVILRERDLSLVRLRLDFIGTLRRGLYRAVAHAEWQFLVRERLSDIAKALTADGERVGQGTNFFLRLPASLAMATAQLAIAIRLAPLITLATVAAACVVFAVVRRYAAASYRVAHDMAQGNRAAFAEISALLDGLKLSKSHSLEYHHVAAFDRVVAEQHSRTLAFARGGFGTRMAIQIGAGAALGLYVLAATEFAQLATATVIVTAAIFARLLPLVFDLQQSARAVVAMLPVFAQWRDLADRAAAAGEPPAPEAAPRVALTSELRLAGIGFRYDKARDEAALAGIELVFPAGSITAIVGPSGAGKSTLADLVMGLIAPDTGQVLVDGVPLDAIGLAAWRRSIAYVPQENFLFHDTVRANLLWAAAGAGEDEIGRALVLAAADHFVARLPHGLDTIVGERGARLSGGERQRLALARALIRRPTLLILDEATSALDGETENAVGAAIERLRGHATVIVVAHRLATIRRADRIVVVEGGRAVESGRRDELSQAEDGRFAALLRAGADVPELLP